MISLINLLREIEIKPQGQIKLKDLEYDPNVDIIYPGIHNRGKRRVNGSEEFKWWKMDMLDGYGKNLIFIKRPNPDKKFWYHGKYKLEIPNISTPENQKWWND